MKPINQVALTHWAMLNGKGVPKEDFIFSCYFIHGDHKGSVADNLTRNLKEEIQDSLLHRHPKAAQLIQYWSPYFLKPEATPAADATRFILDVYNSMEDVEALFSDQITPGVTRAVKDSISDLFFKRPHTKIGWTLQLTTSGKGSFNCIRQQLITEPGDLTLLSPDALYDYRREESAEEWTHIWIYFPADKGLLEWLKWPEVGPNIYHLNTQGDDFAALQQLFESVIENFKGNLPFVDQLARNLLEQILIRCRQLAPDGQQGVMDPRISNAVTFISHNFDRPFTVNDLAEEVGLSPARLSTLFKQQTGTSVLRWRDERRMARASQLLVQTQQAINKVAELVGYTDPLYFTRCFRQHLGCSPRDFRAQSRSHSIEP